MPGALVGAAFTEVLRAVGAYIVPWMVRSSSGLYGSIGVIFALISWLLVFGRLVVFVAMLEVTIWESRHGTIEITVEVPDMSGSDSWTVDRSIGGQDPVGEEAGEEVGELPRSAPTA